MGNANITVNRYNVFLAELAIDGNVTRAAKAVGVDRSNAYQRRLRNPEFAERWADAIEEATDAIEAEAYRRAVIGTDKGVWHQGAMVGTERQYSDSLLLAMLKAKRPREYGDKSKMELTGADGGPVKVEESPTVIGRRLAFALATALRAKATAYPVSPEAICGAPDADAGHFGIGEDAL